MNEQIKELAHQADFVGKKHSGNFWKWGYIDPELETKLEKFAELIVQECAQAVFDTELDDCCSDSDVICAISFHLKKHFGVTE